MEIFLILQTHFDVKNFWAVDILFIPFWYNLFPKWLWNKWNWPCKVLKHIQNPIIFDYFVNTMGIYYILLILFIVEIFISLLTSVVARGFLVKQAMNNDRNRFKYNNVSLEIWYQLADQLVWKIMNNATI